jgi:hypothetical protein
MPSNFIDIFNDDAFSIDSLTDAVSLIDHIPGQAGALTFAGAGEPLATTKAVIEYRASAFNVIATSPRGAPAPQETRDKATVVEVKIPHIKKQQTIGAAAVQDARAFGTTELETVQSVVNTAMKKLTGNLDFTLEHLRLGALHGVVRDADGSELLNLFDTFNIAEPAPVEFLSSTGSLRPSIMDTKRRIEVAAKMLLPPTAEVVALCSPGFFDLLTKHPDVVVAYANYEAAASQLAGDVRKGFLFGGVTWIEYRGSDSVELETPSSGDLVGQIGIADGDCRFFLTGVPGLYTEKYAPADYWETVNTMALPRYARIALDQSFNRWVQLEIQSNPMPIVTRPATLIRGTFS